MVATLQSALCSGFYVEPSDYRPLDEIPDPRVIIRWMVHPILQEKYATAVHDMTTFAVVAADPEMREMRNARDAMLVAMKSILEFAGFEIDVDDHEGADYLVVGYP